MSTNAFIGRTEPPADSDLTDALGPAKAVWDRLLADLAAEHGLTNSEWKCYSSKSGWALRVKRKERTIVWLAPLRGAFEVLFILGEKAMEAARAARLPAKAQQAMRAAVKYPEGTGVRFAIKSGRDLGMLQRLAAIKITH